MDTSELAERGIGFQAIGFGLAGCVSLAILETFSGSNFWLYEAFATATTKQRWALMVPLAVTFDWGRKMFEKAKAIREAQKTRIREAGRAEENARVRALLDRPDVSLPPDIAEEIFGGQSQSRA